MNAQERYIEAIEKRLGIRPYLAKWPVGEDVKVGTIGTRGSGHAFTIRGDLERFEPIELAPPDEAPDGLNFATERGVDVKVSATGNTSGLASQVADVELKAEVTFSRRDQVVLRAAGVRYIRATDEREFAKRIENAYYNGHLAEGDQIVFAVITAESGAAAVSGETGATLTLTGKGKVVGVGEQSLGSLKAGIEIASTSKTALEVPMTNGFVIAMRLLEIDIRGIFFRDFTTKDVKRAIGEAAPGVAYLVEFERKQPSEAAQKS